MMYGPAQADAEVAENLHLGDRRTLALFELARAALSIGTNPATIELALVNVLNTTSKVEQAYIRAVVRYAQKEG